MWIAYRFWMCRYPVDMMSLVTGPMQSDPDAVTAIGEAAAEGLLAGGVLPVIKHIPGHGRAGSDSHKSLPVVDTDIKKLEESGL